MPSYPFTLYSLPDGQTTEGIMTRLRSEDAKWLRYNNIKISIEELRTGEIVIYADYGELLDDDTTLEYAYIVPEGEQCIVSMQKLREKLEKIIK